MAESSDLEHVSFTYDRISWTWDGNGEPVTAESSWQGEEVDDGRSSAHEGAPTGGPASGSLSVRVRARQNRDGNKVWAATSIVGRGDARTPRGGDGPAAGIELSFEFQYRNDSRTQHGTAVTDAAGEAIIAVPRPAPGEPVREFRFGLESARRQQRRLQLGGDHSTGWVAG